MPGLKFHAQMPMPLLIICMENIRTMYLNGSLQKKPAPEMMKVNRSKATYVCVLWPYGHLGSCFGLLYSLKQKRSRLFSRLYGRRHHFYLICGAGCTCLVVFSCGPERAFYSTLHHTLAFFFLMQGVLRKILRSGI